MARDVITPVQTVINTGTVSGAGTAINVTNGAQLNIDGVTDRYLLVVNNSFAGAKIVTVKAGVYPPAFRQGLGDATFSCTQTTQNNYFPLESARFAQADGTIYIDFEAAMTGTVWVIKLPAEYS